MPEARLSMKVVHHDPSDAIANNTPIFVGAVATQCLVGEVDASLLRMTSVTFRDGARNRVHRHTCDQVLVVTAGRGIVATELETRKVGVGDVIVIPAGEAHWHGAAEGATFTHLSIVTPHETQVDEESGDVSVIESSAWMGGSR
jgi:quercetin dioxygenase-like cupin family protein